MTGQELHRYFMQRIDAAYTGYWDVTKANRLFRDVLFTCTDRSSLDEDSQKEFDKVAQDIITERTFSINNNRISTAPIGITSVASNVGIYTVVTFLPHNLVAGDQVSFSGIGGVSGTVLNGTTQTVVTVTTTTSFTVQVGALTNVGTPNTGQIITSSMVGDYLHLYAVKTKFTELQTGLRVVATSGTSPITVRFNNRSKLRDGSMITLSGMTSTPAANGTWYVKQLNSKSYQLYQNADLTTASTGGVISSTTQGVVNYVWYESATPYFSERKIDQQDTPTVELPGYEFAEKQIKFYPMNRVCSEILLDYIRIPQYFIDVADNAFNLSMVYSEPFQYYLIRMAMKSISVPLRDPALNQGATQEIIEQR